MRTPTLAIQVDTRELDRLAKGFEALSDGLRNRVLSRALNRVGSTAVTKIARTVSQEAGVLVRDVKKAFHVTRARAGNQVFAIDSSAGWLPLSRFKPVQRRKGVSAAPWKKRRVFPHTFLATTKSGHRGVFVRTGKGRTPIRQLYGPNISRELVRGSSGEVMSEVVNTVLPKRLKVEFAFEVSRVKGRFGL